MELYQENQHQPSWMMSEDDQEADRVVAMNSSGVVETYENEDGKKMKCDGDMCVLEDDSHEDDSAKPVETFEPITSSSSPSYMRYVMYVVIFLILCAMAYFGYKKFYCASWFL